METNKLIRLEDVKFSPALSNQEASIVRNSRLLPVSQSRKIDVAMAVSDIVDASLIVLGHTKTHFKNDERKMIENEIVIDIFTKFSNLTIEEVREACRLGVRGEFKNKPDEIIYFSVTTVYGWLKAYSESVRREALAKQARFEQDQFTPLPPSKEELLRREEEFIQDYIIKPYNHFLETGEYTFNNRGNVIYNKLDKLGVIPFSKERKKEIFKVAQELVKSKLIANPSTEARRRYKELESGKGEGHQLVIVEAKDLALNLFMKEMKEQKMDLQEFIEMRKTTEEF